MERITQKRARKLEISSLLLRNAFLWCSVSFRRKLRDTSTGSIRLEGTNNSCCAASKVLRSYLKILGGL